MSQPPPRPVDIWIGTTKTYLTWSIASTFVLFPPLGVVAMILSLKARARFMDKRMPEGSRLADWAKTLNTVSLILGVIGYLSLFAINASLHHFTRPSS